jgi:P-type E1-E2 ATPase
VRRASLILTTSRRLPDLPKFASRLLHYGDIIRIRADTRIPTDGLVVDGSSEVDQSSTTGESLPTPKSPGSAVIAGTLNLNGQLDIQVTRLLHENSLARIAGLVKLAQASKSRFQDVADRVSAIILPVAAVVAVSSLVR